jgi:hypothetical protein
LKLCETSQEIIYRRFFSADLFEGDMLFPASSKPGDVSYSIVILKTFCIFPTKSSVACYVVVTV